MFFFYGMVPVSIKQRSEHSAKNNPMGVSITTGTRNAAAVLAQEVQQAAWHMKLFWPFLAAFGALAYFVNPFVVLGFPLWIIIQRLILKEMRGRNEAFGQVVEVHAAELINYPGFDLDYEYWLAAKQLSTNGSYMREGLFPQYEHLGYAYTEYPEMSPRHAEMKKYLHTHEKRARAWVKRNEKGILKWKAIFENM